MRKHGLDEKEMELVKILISDCKSTGDIQKKLKRLFAGTIEQMLEVEMEEHLEYEKNNVVGNNSRNSRNGYGKKTIVDLDLCQYLGLVIFAPYAYPIILRVHKSITEAK